MNAKNKGSISSSVKGYWENLLSDDIKLLALPNRELTLSHSASKGSLLRTYFSSEVTSSIRSYVSSPENLEIFLISSLTVLLHRYTNQNDIAFGLIINNNDQLGVNDNLSFFRNTIAPSFDFNTVYKSTENRVLLNFENYYPNNDFLNDFDLVHKNGQNSLLDVVLTINTLSANNSVNGDEGIVYVGEVSSDSNIKFILEIEQSQIRFDVIYNDDVFERKLIAQLMAHFKNIVPRLIEQSSLEIGNIDFLSTQERNTLLKEFNTPVVDYPREKTIVDLLNEQAVKTPNSIAVVYEDNSLTYDELNKLSNQFAHYLIKSKGATKGDLACLILDRSEWLIICMMGIMKAGAAYVPVDPNYPDKRKEYIKEDSNCDFTIDAAVIEEFNSTRDNYATDAIRSVQLDPYDLIYIIYTSGTTGNPKGVMLEHRNIVSLFVNNNQFYDFNENDVWTMFHSYCFDFSVWEIYGALLFGGKLVIPSSDVVKDPYEFMSLLINEEVTILNQTPSSFLNIMGSLPTGDVDLKLRYVIFGGESLFPKYLEKWYHKFPGIQFVNGYGITETTIFTTFNIIDDEDIRTNVSNIGNCISTLTSHVVNSNNQLQPVGVIGELCISGHGLARGYLNRPELTNEKFIMNPFEPGDKMYRSGDLVRRLADGTLEYIGRIDHQVKIRGHRIELGEIESIINAIDSIKRTIVLPNTNEEGETRLVGYIQANGEKPEMNSIRLELVNKLPEFMVPTFLMWVDEFPTNANGKIDKEKLPEPGYLRSNSDVIFKKPRTKVEKRIADIWEKELKISGIGVDDNFFEMGGTSLMAQKVVNAIMKTLKVRIPVTKLYQHTTIDALSKFVEGDKETTLYSKRKAKGSNNSNDVAVIGMAGRFPGVSTIDEFWDVLKNGKETISFFTKEELDKSIPESLRNDSLYVAARGVVPSVKMFDARFFGLTPKLAEAMDPQQRLFLELAWEALEESGHLPEHYKGRVGVYAGTGTNTYYKKNILPNSELIETVGQLHLDTVNEKDYISSRTAYHLNLRGPAVSVQSACSTSLLAIAEAVESIRNGHCEVALAGGSSITAPINSGHLYQEGSMLSTDGHCRPFDSQAKGTVFSDGAGVVVLKDLEEAKKDGDYIYSVIKGVGINNDGGGKGSFTAPSAEGQANAIKSAIDDADISPDTISYVEAHGTATPLGDPIEMDGLTLAFGDQSKKNYCGLGSLKSNMGHLTAAAGVAGLIKTILAIHHKELPPSLGYEKPNPVIDFENSPFYVTDKLASWNVEGLRRAGVSSFGVGGTNVHLVLEEYEMNVKDSTNHRPVQIFPISAKTSTSVEGYETALKNYLDSKESVNLADVAYTLSTTKASFNNRRFIIASDSKEVSELLTNNDIKTTQSSVVKIVPSEIVFLLPGQGSQFLNMGKELYDGEVVFREAVDRCADLLLDILQLDIRNVIFSDENNEEAESKLKDTRYTQPALFTIEYALSQLWLSWGIKPTVICGHSLGEFVGAHLSGVFSLEDALQLVAMRGILVSTLPKGSMLTVRIDVEALIKIMPKTLSVAAVNSQKLCVVSGEDEEIEKFSEVLKEQSLPYKLLATSHAFHSAMMDPILEEFGALVRNINLKIPEIPIISTVTGTWLTNDEAVDATYWTDHLRNTVRFSDALDTIVKLEDIVLLEVGPGNALTTLSRQNKEARKLKSIASLPIAKSDENAYYGVLNALGQLWLIGLSIDWNTFYANQNRLRLRLPTYVFDRKPCWVDPIVSNPITERTYLDSNQLIHTLIEKPKSVTPMRNVSILNKISELISNTYGIEIEIADKNLSFLELGLDSLILTQMAITCKKEFKIPITFRQLNEDINSPELLANYLDKNLPEEAPAPQVVQQPVAAVNHVQQATPINYTNAGTNQTAIGLIGEQLQLLSKQLQLLQGGTVSQDPQRQQQPVAPTNNVVFKKVNGHASSEILSEQEKLEHKKPFGASPRIEKQSTGLDMVQSKFLNDLTSKYNKKTIKSKNYAQDNRAKMADPRVVSGFKPLTKELVYPIVIGKSQGNRLWDLDGNEYIDALNGFGSCFFGYQPDFIKEAMHKQVDLGYEVGPQHPLAGEVCELLCEFTGHDRAALCNTGSEAVLGAMRIARTVTGRSLIVAFTGSYHGINDEGIVRGSQKKKTFPAAAGILPEAVQNMLILDYGTEESLQIIKESAHELAGVLVEPVQSRRPEFQPIEFIKKVREITTAEEIPFIFDEVITGFRMHPGGAQALFDVKADLATYGKVMGGGVSIGAILGKKEYMDALDGGFWQYGDDSYPEVGVTYFAGTFVRHPLALASSKASLLYMKSQGPGLQSNLSAKTERMAKSLNDTFTKNGLPIEITYFGSLWRLKFKKDIPYSELLFVSMREKGIHIWDGFPCFLTTAYTDNDIDFLMKTLLSSVDELVAVGILNKEASINGHTVEAPSSFEKLNTPPVPGARLGRDEKGQPAWYVADANQESGFMKIDI